MSAPKWTPIESVHSTPTVTRKIERDGRLVCMVSAGASAQDWALLQAAPELFEALFALVVECESSPYFKRDLSQARHALSRATGGTNG